MALAAFEHALEAGAYDITCDLLESAAESATARGEYATLHTWLARLPDGVCDERPVLSLWSG